MVAVLLHEASHVRQTGAYGRRLGALIEKYSLPDSFNDDAVQLRFKEDPAFAASVEKETELFLAAAGAGDFAEAKRLAGEACDLMRTRQARWMIGADAYLIEAEDIWLTFEGSGQWAAYQSEINRREAGLPAADVIRTSRGANGGRRRKGSLWSWRSIATWARRGSATHSVTAPRACWR